MPKLITHDEQGNATTTDSRTLSEAKAKRIAAVTALRDLKRHPGTLATGLGWSVDLRDVTDEGNIRGKALLAVRRIADGDTTTISFMGADDVLRNLTPSQMASVGEAVDAYISAVYARSWALKAGIEELTDNDTVDGYNISTGWPVSE